MRRDETETLGIRAGIYCVALAHKQTLRQRLAGLAAEAGLRAADTLAGQLLLLIDGAWAAARIYGPANAATTLPAAADALIAAQR